MIGLDLNEGMLEVAHTTSSNLHPLIEWRKGVVKEIPFHDLSFDVFFVSKASNFFSICWLRYERYIVCSRQPAFKSLKVLIVKYTIQAEDDYNIGIHLVVLPIMTVFVTG